MTEWKPPEAPKEGEPPVKAVDPRVVSIHEPGTPCPLNPPPPTGWKYWTEPVPSGGTELAQQILNDLTSYPMGSFVQTWLGGQVVGARKEWHTWKGSTGEMGCFKGVNLMKRIADLSTVTQVPAIAQSRTPWMEIARQEIGVRDYPGPEYEPRVVEYLKSTGLEANEDETSWCSAFVNWCITRASLRGTNSALARSWLKWGRTLTEPEPGCIVVLWRESPQSWKGHVGFFDGFDHGRIRLLGGNQGGGVDWQEVCYVLCPTERLLGYRMPA